MKQARNLQTLTRGKSVALLIKQNGYIRVLDILDIGISTERETVALLLKKNGLEKSNVPHNKK
jgi:hypothetical protein